MDEINKGQSLDALNVRGQTNELDAFSIRLKMNTRGQQPVVRTLTDLFQLDKMHETVLTKLTSKQSQFLLADQPFKDFEHNTFVVQVTLAQPVPGETFSFDILYQSDS